MIDDDYLLCYDEDTDDIAKSFINAGLLTLIDGKPFEVSKEVYERAKNNNNIMDAQDQMNLFSHDILAGYGLYYCKVFKKKDKYICYWKRGNTLD